MIAKTFLSLALLCIGLSGLSKPTKIDSTVYAFAKSFPDSTQVSIGIITNGKIEYKGFLKTGNSFQSIQNENSVFEIGSISKVFTANLLAHLVLESNLSLDTPVQELVDFPLHSNDYPSSEITLKNLGNHTAGFPPFPNNFIQYFHFQSPVVGYNTAVLEEYLEKQLGLSSRAGEKYQYSNFGFATLGYLIEKMETSDYETLLQDHICKKYGLSSTTLDQTLVAERLVEGRNAAGQAIVNKSWGVFKASGGICSTVSDLCKYIQVNFLNDPVLALQRQKTFDMEYGGMALGWHLPKVGRNCKWYNHNGGMEGYRSSLFFDEESKSGVVVLSNVSVYHVDGNKIDGLAYELMRIAYIKSPGAECKNAFLEGALEEGWGSDKLEEIANSESDANPLVGVWIRKNENQTITRSFTQDFKTQTDFHRDEEIDVWGYYTLENGKVIFEDVGGAACQSDGRYDYTIAGDTLQFKVVEDLCEGRKTDLQETWVRRK